MFPTTHWSLVIQAGDEDAAVKRAALVDLLRDYAPALRSFLLVTRRVSPDDVDDALQSFLADKVLAEDLMPKADRAQGRFRTFLLSSLNHFLLNRAEHEARLKRRPRSGAVVSLDALNGDGGTECGGVPPAMTAAIADPHSSDPAVAFDSAWARQVLRQAVERTEAECRQAGRADVWTVLEARVLAPTLDGSEPAAYATLVGKHGIASAEEAANLLVTGKRMLMRQLRSVVCRYERDEAAIDAEIADLRAALATRRG